MDNINLADKDMNNKDMNNKDVNKKKVVFICTGNTCRSQMAEIIASKLWGDKVSVVSRGFCRSGEQITDEAVKALEAKGFEVTGEHYSIRLKGEELDKADLILTMEQQHKKLIAGSLPMVKDKVFTLLEYVGDTSESLDIADPYSLGFEDYNTCCERILNCIKAIDVDKI